jgi:hypothetical protein
MVWAVVKGCRQHVCPFSPQVGCKTLCPAAAAPFCRLSSLTCILHAKPSLPEGSFHHVSNLQSSALKSAPAALGSLVSCPVLERLGLHEDFLPLNSTSASWRCCCCCCLALLCCGCCKVNTSVYVIPSLASWTALLPNNLTGAAAFYFLLLLLLLLRPGQHERVRHRPA